jgi:hypothetical protein
LHVIVNSSNSSVGLLRTAAEYLGTVAVDVAPNAYDSPATVGLGGVAFDPIAAGSTNVSATAIGFTSQNILGVTVTP